MQVSVIVCSEYMIYRLQSQSLKSADARDGSVPVFVCDLSPPVQHPSWRAGPQPLSRSTIRQMRTSSTSSTSPRSTASARSRAVCLALLSFCGAPLASNGAAACELGFQTHAAGAAIVAGDPVTFHAHGGLNDALRDAARGSAYLFRFDGAGGSADGEATVAAGRLTRTFERIGPHVATVYCNPSPGVAQNASDSMLTDAWPLARVRFDVRAAAVRRCFKYKVEHPRRSASRRAIFISVWDTRQPTHERAASLTAQFVSTHAAPVVELSSMTKSGPAPALPVQGAHNVTGTEFAWEVAVPEVYDGPMDAPLQVRVSPPAGLSLFGCSIAATTAHVSRAWRSLPCESEHAEADVRVMDAGQTNASESTRLVETVSLSQNPCRPSELALTVRTAGGGTALLLTNELTGGHPQLDDSAGRFTRINDLIGWVCNEIQTTSATTCPITLIYSTLPLMASYSTELLLSTDAGLLHFAAAAGASAASLTNLSSAIGADLSGDLRMSVTIPSPCVELQSSSVPCIYLIELRAPPVVVSTCAELEQPWRRQTFASVVSTLCGAASCDWQIQSAVRDFHRNADIYLVRAMGRSLTLVSTSESYDHSSSSPDVQVEFEFGASEGACNGAVNHTIVHANGHELIAYGRQVWVSADGGRAFHRLATLPGSEIAEYVTTTTFQSGFAMVTRTNQVYYGRTDVAHLAAIVSPLAHYSSPQLYWSSIGSLLAFDVEVSIDNVSISAVTSLPVEESVVSDDWSFECALVPSWFTGTVSVSCGDELQCPDGCFTAQHIGRRIITASGGSIQIVNVANGTASGIVVQPLQPEGQRAAQQLSFTKLHPAGLNSTAQCGRWIAALTPATIAGQPNEVSGWQFYDRGKTVLTRGLSRVDRHSFLVVDVMNSTHALLAQYGTVCLEDGTNHTAVEAGLWQLYDMRGYTEARSVVNGALELNATDSGRFVASSVEQPQDPLLLADASHVTIVAADGTERWCLIDAASVTSHGFQVQVADWVVPANATVLVNSWSAFAVDAILTNSNFRKRRPWRLLVPPCDSGDTNDVQAAFRSVELFQGGGRHMGSMVRYVDLNEQAEFNSANSATKLHATRLHPHAIEVSVSHPRTATGNTAVVASVSLTQRLSDRSSTVVKFAPSATAPDASGSAASLRCLVGAQSAIIFTGCQPNTRLVHADTTGRLLLQGTGFTPVYGRWTTLRTNYRPPSALGVAVPTTDNIYNADPAVPREPRYQRYAVSRGSGTYKHCLDKPDRQACACPASASVSAQPGQLALTDCVQEVLTVHFSVPFVPNLIVIPDSASSPEGASPLRVLYQLEELNGRTDFCINTTAAGASCADFQDDGSDPRSASGRRTFVIDPAKSDALVWGGGELYHFRATVTDGTAASLCALETEFVVYVDA